MNDNVEKPLLAEITYAASLARYDSGSSPAGSAEAN
jgi:hypothetical protein